nr:MAG: hypothetical protein [Bacteriophage sp.]
MSLLYIFFTLMSLVLNRAFGLSSAAALLFRLIASMTLHPAAITYPPSSLYLTTYPQYPHFLPG